MVFTLLIGFILSTCSILLDKMEVGMLYNTVFSLSF